MSHHCTRLLLCLTIFILVPYGDLHVSDLRTQLRLYGAAFASRYEFPFVVELRAFDWHLCGGTLITERHVLTAGHCLWALQEHHVVRISSFVRIGTDTKIGSGKRYNIQSFHIHEKFNYSDPTDSHDIGIITLKKPVDLEDGLKLASLPEEDVPRNVVATVVGWGSTEKYYWSKTLKKLDVIVLSNEECQKILQNMDVIIKPGRLCTLGSQNKGTCAGDSGGPLIFNGTVVGVTSSANECAKGMPDLFTRVFYFRDYIDDIIKSDS